MFHIPRCSSNSIKQQMAKVLLVIRDTLQALSVCASDWRYTAEPRSYPWILGNWVGQGRKEWSSSPAQDTQHIYSTASLEKHFLILAFGELSLFLASRHNVREETKFFVLLWHPTHHMVLSNTLWTQMPLLTYGTAAAWPVSWLHNSDIFLKSSPFLSIAGVQQSQHLCLGCQKSISIC